MSIAEVLDLTRDMFLTAFLVALPALAVSLIVGLLVSILQTITSIQDQTLSYVPRILLVGAVIVFTMSFTLELAINFMYRMFEHAAGVAR
jgi:flagellar biosynthesis protein FliQ